uniref:U-theraphotoxin-Lk1a n=1 Tax=Lasiodora klugi TaxID=2013881 RepID=LK1A_LASKL
CGGVDAPCDKDRPDCCSYAECLKPAGYGWWHGTYYCYRKKE